MKNKYSNNANDKKNQFSSKQQLIASLHTNIIYFLQKSFVYYENFKDNTDDILLFMITINTAIELSFNYIILKQNNKLSQILSDKLNRKCSKEDLIRAYPNNIHDVITLFSAQKLRKYIFQNQYISDDIKKMSYIRNRILHGIYEYKSDSADVTIYSQLLFEYLNYIRDKYQVNFLDSIIDFEKQVNNDMNDLNRKLYHYVNNSPIKQLVMDKIKFHPNNLSKEKLDVQITEVVSLANILFEKANIPFDFTCYGCGEDKYLYTFSETINYDMIEERTQQFCLYCKEYLDNLIIEECEYDDDGNITGCNFNGFCARCGERCNSFICFSCESIF